MTPSAFFHTARHHPRHTSAHDDDGTTGALAIAILFALFALVSFAIDQSISLPS